MTLSMVIREMIDNSTSGWLYKIVKLIGIGKEKKIERDEESKKKRE